MRIALIAEWVDAWRGGAETSTLQFLYHLLDQGVEVHLFTRSRPASVPGLTVRHIGGASMSRTRRSVTFAHRVEHILRAERFDVRHAITPCRYIDIYQPRGGTVAETIERNLATIDRRFLRTLKRLANHLNVKQRHALHLERTLMRHPDGPVIVAISDYVVRQLRKHYALPPERIRKVFNGVDVTVADPSQRAVVRRDLRNEFGIAADDLFVLLVAHNFKLKGVGRWMEAHALLLRRGANHVRALVVGKGDHPRWHHRAHALGLDGHLRFVGPSSRIQDFYAAADVLVHPTYYDPCSRVVLEAMAAGLPCVASPWDGAAEMIENGVNGFILPDSIAAEAIAARVLELGDAEKRQMMGARASKIAERVGMDRHAKQMLEVYRELLSAGREVCATG